MASKRHHATKSAEVTSTTGLAAIASAVARELKRAGVSYNDRHVRVSTHGTDVRFVLPGRFQGVPADAQAIVDVLAVGPDRIVTKARPFAGDMHYDKRFGDAMERRVRGVLEQGHSTARHHASKPKRPSQRELTISHMRIAGFDNDKAAWTRLLIENKISYAVAKKAWEDGVKMRQAGIPRTHHATKKDSGRTFAEAVAAGDSYQLETLDGRHSLYMPGSRGIAQTLRNARKSAWKHRIGQRIRVYRVLPGSRIGAMMIQEVDEVTL